MHKRVLLPAIIIIVFSNTLLSQIPTNGLVGYWPFSGNANDSSGNNLNGTVNGAILTEDRFGNPSSAYSFDGNDDYILVNDDDLLSFPNNEFTFSFWVNPTLTQLPASPAFEEDFESINYWGGDLSFSVQNDKWVRHSGATASVGTGPNGAQSGSKYRYYETTIPGDYHSVPYHGSMYSPAIDLTTSDTSELSFYFHAYGAKMGTLNVKVGSSSLGYTTVYTLSGQQQTSSSAPWQNVTVDLSAFLGEVVQLEFEYTSQVGQDCFTGDIAIDNITVSQSTQYSYSPEIGIMGKREFSQPYVYDWEYNIFGTTDTTVGLVCWTNNGQNGVFGDGQSVLHSMNFTPGVWTNFIYSSDGDSLRYYKNGVKLGTIPKNTSGLNLSNQDGDLTFGLAGEWNQFRYLDGKLDDIIIYDRALTQTEIDSISLGNHLPCSSVTATDTRSECDSYTWLDGNTYTSSNNTATFNIVGGAADGCDSIVTLDLTITTDTSYTNITACNSVVWNGTTYDSSGTYTGSSISNNYSMSFDGVDDYVDVGNNSVLDVDNSVTIEAWINPANLSNRHGIYSTRKNNDPGSFQLEIGSDAIGTNYVAVTGVGTYVAITGSNVINTSSGWVHIAYTRDGVGNNHQIYINGIPQIINTNPYTFINNNASKEIGRGTSLLQNYEGQIDQVRIWDIALTQIEIQNYMDCSPEVNKVGLVGYWNFEEGSGTTVFDLTSNANNGTLNGAAYDTDAPSQLCPFTNASGCDSVAILNLNIDAITGTDTQLACNSYTWIDGNTYTTNNNTATFYFVGGSASGCDSIVSLNLTITNNYTSSDTIVYYVSNVDFQSNSPKTYLESIDSTLSSNGGCDSISLNYINYVFNPNNCTDTTIITVFDSILVNDTISIYDTTFTNSFDTTFITNYDTTFITVFDSVLVLDSISIYDTTFINSFDTTFITNYDTTFITIFDSVLVLDSISIFDTTFINSFDTTFITNYDTTFITVFDSLLVIDSISIFDTSFVTYYDTNYFTIYDTITYYDSILVSVTDTLIIHINLSAISSPNNSNTLKIYPNPANDIVFIDNGNFSSMSNYSLKIINSLGQDVFNSFITISQFQIPITSFGGVGLYYIQLYDDTGNLIEIRKLIIQ